MMFFKKKEPTLKLITVGKDGAILKGNDIMFDFAFYRFEKHRGNTSLPCYWTRIEEAEKVFARIKAVEVSE
jgi:hypothetical protein